MDFETMLEERYSCRAFRPEPVADQILDGIFALAQRAPSWCNTQPWHVHLLGGEALSTFAQGLGEHVLTAEQRADLGVPSYEGVHAERRREAGYGLYSALGIDRSDREGRARQMLKNFSFFGAPHAAVVTTDRSLGAYGAVDCGGYVTTLMLAAQSMGMGVIAQGAIAMYSDFVREFLDLSDDRMVVCGIALGFPDEVDPVNAFRTSRSDVSAVVTRVGS